MYQVLARKYRPKNFSELVGQSHVSKALMGALDNERLHHAYLFTGTRGVGKTTIARILAKCLNCETGITNNPCGTCGTCQSIDAGQFIDLIEIDAASRTKVEDTRELLDQVPYAPTQGRYKVYLIDEVHMLSTHSFNALLKTLEEPPAHVKFLLATTDPQKLPITVMSRCLQFVLRPLPKDEIQSHLAHVLEQEDVAFDSDALWKLAESAQGSIRDALSLTDQAIAYGQGKVNADDVDAMLGLIDSAQVTELVTAVHAQDKQKIAELLAIMRAQMVDAKAVLDQLVELLFNLALIKDLPEVGLDMSDSQLIALDVLASKLHPADIQLYYEIACKGRDSLRLASNPQQGLEMTILRLLAFTPFTGTSTGLSKTQGLSQDANGLGSDTDEELATTQEGEESKKKASKLSEAGQSGRQLQENQPQPIQPQGNKVEETADAVQVVNQAGVVLPLKEQKDISQTILETGVGVGAIATKTPEEIDKTQKANTANPAAQQTKSSDLFVDAVVSLSETNYKEQIQDKHKISSQDNPKLTDVEDSLYSAEPKVGIETQPILKADDICENAIQPASIKQETPNQGKSTISETTSQIVYEQAKSGDDILSQLNPEAIELTGEWTLAKWDYWLSINELPPAIYNIARKGVMKGSIAGRCAFEMPKNMQMLTTQFYERLSKVVLNSFKTAELELVEVDAVADTPEIQQNKRRQYVQELAEHSIGKEPLVAFLIEEFGASVGEVKLKA